MTEAQNSLGGTKEPTITNRYLGRDGLYYNGYMGSIDCAQDAFDEAFDRIKESMAKDLGMGCNEG